MTRVVRTLRHLLLNVVDVLLESHHLRQLVVLLLLVMLRVQRVIIRLLLLWQKHIAQLLHQNYLVSLVGFRLQLGLRLGLHDFVAHLALLDGVPELVLDGCR